MRPSKQSKTEDKHILSISQTVQERVGADDSVRPLLRFCAALLVGPYKFYFRNLQISCIVEYYPFNVCFAFHSASRSA